MFKNFPAAVLLHYILVVGIAACPARSLAQMPSNAISPATATGAAPGTTTDGVREDVSVGSGGLHIVIPITTLSGKGGQSFTLAYVYDSHSYGFRETVDPSTGFVQAGWQSTTPFSSGLNLNIPMLTADRDYVTTYTNTNNGLPIHLYCTTNWRFTDEEGTVHGFTVPSTPGITRDCIPNQPGFPQQYDVMKGDSSDGSFYYLDVSNPNAIVITAKNGTKYNFPALNTSVGTGDQIFWYSHNVSTIVDTNGNTITFQPGTITDSVGHVITLTNGPSWQDSNGNTQTVTFPALTTSYTPPKWPPTPSYWTFNAPIGCQFSNFYPPSYPANQTIPIFNGQTRFGGPGFTSAIQLPGGALYQLFFDQLGELLGIVYPGGGYTQYDWQTFTTSMNTGTVTCPIDYREIVTKHVCSSSSSACSTLANTSYSPIPGPNGSNFSSDETDPLGNLTHYSITFSSGNYAPHEIDRYLYAGQSTLLRTIHTDWSQIGDAGLPSQVTTTLNDVSPTISSKVVMTYDAFNNQKELDEYDYDGSVKRETTTTWMSGTGNYQDTTGHILDRLLTKVVLDPVTGTTVTTTNSYDAIGNVLSTSVKGKNMTALLTQYQRNANGDVTLLTDPKSNQTQYGYANPWIDTNCAQGATSSGKPTTITNALNQVTTYKYFSCTGLLASMTDSNNQTTSYSYDALGRLTQASSPDGGSSTTSYVDTAPQTVTTTTKISSTMNKVTEAFLDGLGHPHKSELVSDPQGATYTAILYDALERKSQQWNPTRCDPDVNPTSCSGETTFGTTQFVYDALGRTTTVTEPDTSTVATSYSGNTTTVTDEAGNSRESVMDGLGRLTQVFEDPGSSPHLNYETDYAYDGFSNLTTVTQKGGTTNSAQWRTRTFVYDALSRLTSATNPESGTISYTYDNDSNLATKTAPGPNNTSNAVITYSYDALNRLLQKSYSGGNATSTVSYGYDGTAPSGCTPPTVVSPTGSGIPTSPTNVKGRRSGMCDASGAAAWVYDNVGRPSIEERKLNGATKNMGYIYYLNGQTSHIYYSSGNRIDTEADADGRQISAIDETNSYVFHNPSFTPSGALKSFGYVPSGGGQVTTQNFYSPRLQLVATYNIFNSDSPAYPLFFSRCYDYHLKNGGTFGNSSANCVFSASAAGDNGNIYQIKNNLDGNRTQNFTYDSLNRISQASTSGPNWGENYTTDAWGNLTNIGPVSGKTSSELLNAAPATVQNRLTGYGYDGAGNTISNGSATYTYDDENRITATAGYTYVYDGDGTRVIKCAGTYPSCSSGTLYWALPGSDTMSESDLSGNINAEYIYFEGMRVARRDVPSNVVHFNLNDQLGTARSVLQLVNATTATVEEDADYYPYGGEIVVSGSSAATRYKFTGKERDTESGLDDFGARYYGSNFGRFMTPDWAARPIAVPYAVFGDPQSLNLYDYVRNDPITFADSTGHFLDHGNMGCDQDNPDECSPADREAAQKAQSQRAAQQQAPTSHGTGLWHRLRQHFSNWFHGHSWNYVRPLREKVTHAVLPAEPRPAVTYANDAAGLVGLFAGEKAGRVLGPVGALVSISNNRDPMNIFTSVLGTIPGPDAGVAINGAFIDGFDYEIHHNNPLAGRTWQNEHFFDPPDGSGSSGDPPNYYDVPHDGGASPSEDCQALGFCN